MTLKQLFLLALGAIALHAQNFSYVDRRCGEDLSNLWLEVVAVVDNSKGMTNEGLTAVAANIAGVFSDGTTIGTRLNNPRTTRVGLVTYNANANVVADLNTYQSIDDLYDGVFGALATVSSSSESYLSNGLAAAEQVFEQGNQNSNRSHYQKVVIVYASTYKGIGSLDPVPVANRLKSSGAIIITVAYNQDGDGSLLTDLQKIGTPGDNFSNTDISGNLLGEVQGALLQANCFCPNGWVQYRSNYTDVNSHRYGVCIQAVGLPTVWRAARLSCRNRWNNGFLANEYSADKHNYVLAVAQDTNGFSQPLTYHIGLSLSSGVYSWEQPNGQPLIPVGDYQPWNSGYPVVSSSLTGVLNQQSSADIAVGWQNINPMTTSANYACEVASCDTDNYCASLGDDDVFLAKNKKH